MNSWYIDRSKNFINDSLDESLNLLYKFRKDSKTEDLVNAMKNSGFLGKALGNPNAALTRFRDHGFLSQNNCVGDSVVDYVEGRLNKSELIIDLILKRPASKDDSPNVKPFCIICKIFNIMFETNTDVDDIFITFYECKEYLMPINSYDDITYELVEKIIGERNYSVGKKFPEPRVKLESNEDTNFSIWFNALKATPLFMPLDNESRRILIPNLKQIDFFKFISINADELSKTPTQSNSCLYDYYCKRETGLLEVIPKVVIKSSVNISNNQTGKYLFEYLFGFKKIGSFNYSKFLKYECFGIFFPFITVPRLAIRQIYLTNKAVGNILYDFIDNHNEAYTSLFEDGKFEYKTHQIKSVCKYEAAILAPFQNLIVYGTPGCGKSYYVKNTLLKDYRQENIIRTTFYQDYTNTDFVGQIMPIVTGEDVTYKFNPGPFSLALRRAVEASNEPVALVIEELNRGNAPSIFGDIFQLLDRENGKSEYQITNVNIQRYLLDNIPDMKFNCIMLPANLSIVATMNTSDQNVFTLDTAFKRRWEFKKLKNKFKADHPYKGFFVPGMDNTTWEMFVDDINKFIEDSPDLQSEDKQLGVFFVTEELLCKDPADETDELKENFAYKVLEYLWDDVAKFERDNWFNSNIKSLDKLVEEYVKMGRGVFKDGIFRKHTS